MWLSHTSIIKVFDGKVTSQQPCSSFFSIQIMYTYISLNEVKSSELSYQPLKLSFSQQLNLQSSVLQTVALPEFSKVWKWIKYSGQCRYSTWIKREVHETTLMHFLKNVIPEWPLELFWTRSFSQAPVRCCDLPAQARVAEPSFVRAPLAVPSTHLTVVQGK